MNNNTPIKLHITLTQALERLAVARDMFNVDNVAYQILDLAITSTATLERDNQQLREELRAANKGAETNAHINLQLIKEKNQLHTALEQCAEALRHAQTILIDEQIDKVLALPAVQDALK